MGQAAVYAEPHTMEGKASTEAPRKSGAQVASELNISVAGISKTLGKPTKTDGIYF